MATTCKEAWGKAATRVNAEGMTNRATSYPVPLVYRGRLLIGSFRYPVGSDPKLGSFALPPDKLLFVDAATIQDVVVADSAARLVRASLVPETGRYWLAFPRSQYEARREELFAAYDQVLPHFVRGGRAPAGAARTLVKRLEDLAPLKKPFYDAVVPEFFGWLAAHL